MGILKEIGAFFGFTAESKFADIFFDGKITEDEASEIFEALEQNKALLDETDANDPNFAHAKFGDDRNVLVRDINSILSKGRSRFSLWGMSIFDQKKNNPAAESPEKEAIAAFNVQLLSGNSGDTCRQVYSYTAYLLPDSKIELFSPSDNYIRYLASPGTDCWE